MESAREAKACVIYTDVSQVGAVLSAYPNGRTENAFSYKAESLPPSIVRGSNKRQVFYF